jgi:hypothetical protein
MNAFAVFLCVMLISSAVLGAPTKSNEEHDKRELRRLQHGKVFEQVKM